VAALLEERKSHFAVSWSVTLTNKWVPKPVYPLWWSTWRKVCKQNSFCVGVVWQIQSIVQHLAQTKKVQNC